MTTTSKLTTPIPPSAKHKGHFFSLITCLLLPLSLADLQASPIDVPNFSLELPAVTDGAFDFSVSSWTESGSGAFQSGVFNPQDAQFPGSSGSGDLPAPALGQQGAFLNISGESGVSRTTAAPLTTIQANTIYTLTIAVGARLDYPLPGFLFGETIMSLLLPDGLVVPGTYLPIDANNITRGTFEDFSVSFTTDASSPLIGQGLRAFIGIAGNTNAGIVFDNVRLDATAVPVPATLANISTRLRVLTDDKVLIGGFIITGTTPKKVIVRAIGPSLAAFNISGALADPVLELHMPDGSVVTNDNWKSTQEQEIIDSNLSPTDDLESAIVATLPPGSYTAILSGNNGGTGVALVEAYDLDQAAGQLANISTRGFVDTDDNVMIGGFIVGGGSEGSARVLVRGIGPSLGTAGVVGALADPTLELHDSNGATLAFNDNWKDTQEAEINATTIPPSDDLESAIVATLAPGAYTAIVGGINNTTGAGLVEAYNLQ